MSIKCPNVLRQVIADEKEIQMGGVMREEKGFGMGRDKAIPIGK